MSHTCQQGTHSGKLLTLEQGLLLALKLLHSLPALSDLRMQLRVELCQMSRTGPK